MKVLVIEDNKADQRLLQEMFRDMNMPAFELVFAENLTKGIAFLDSEDIGIVILDLGLPESQGLDTFLRLKAHAENVSVIVLTGLDDTGIARNSLKEGAQDYLIKGWISTEILKKSIIYAIERQRLIEELRQSNREILFKEERFRILIEENADAMVVLSKKEGVQYQNPAAELLFEGASADYFNDPSFFPFEGGKSIERTLDFPAGIQKTIEIRGVPIEWERLPAFLLTIRDITERKRMEEALQRKTRAYQVISECNQFMVRTSDEQDLIKGICNILVTLGGYRCAWVGYARHDKDKTVEPVVQSGFEQEYLKNLRISWKKGRHGKGPTGTAIRTGNPIVIHDIPNNPKCGSWSSEAIRRDYSTVAAFPLIIQEQAIGALTIYSSNPEALDPEETHLLLEMTGDLAFGIASIRTTVEHKQAEEKIESLAKFPEENPNPIFRIAYDGVLLFANRSAEFLINELRLSVGTKIPEFLETIIKEGIESGSQLELEKTAGERTYLFTIAPIIGQNYVNLYGLDITGRKQAEENLKISLAKYKVLFESLPIAITISDKLGNIVESNTRAEEILGLSIEEQSKRKIDGTEWQLIRSDGALMPADEYASVRALKENRLVQDVEMGIVKENSAVTWINVTAVPIPLKDYGVAIAYGDITERKKMEDKLRESEERYRLLFNSIDEGFCIIEVIFDENEKPIDYRFLEINPSFEKQTGLIDAQGRRMRELAPKHEEYWFEIYGKIAVTGQPARFVNRAEQLHRWYDVYAFRLGQPENRQVAILFDDITERKRVEEELRVAQEKFTKAFLSAPDVITISELDSGRFVEVNDAATAIFGYSREELIGKSALDLGIWQKKEDRAVFIDQLREHGRVHQYEIVERRKSGELFNAQINADNISIGGMNYLITIIRDITERKRTEEQLTEFNERFKNVARATNDIVWDWELTTNKLWWSDSIYTAFGYSHDDIEPTIESWYTRLHPEDRDRVVTSIHAVIDGGGPFWSGEYRFRKANSSYAFIFDRGFVIRDNLGKTVRMVGAMLDITERKRVEEALRQSEEKFRRISSLISNFAFSCRKTPGSDYAIDWMSGAVEQITGFSVEEINARLCWRCLVIDEDLPVFDKNVTGLLPGESASSEIRIRHKTGGVVWLDTFAQCVMEKNDPVSHRLYGACRDITDRKRADEVLRETTEYLHKLIDYASAPIMVWDPRFQITRFNEAFEHLTGRTEQEVLGQKIDILFPAESREASLSLIKKTLEGERWDSVKIPIIAAAGTIHTLLWNSANILTADLELISTIAQGIDITQSERVEEELRQSEKRYRNVVEDQTELICRFTPDGTLTFVNDAYCRYFGLKHGECIGKRHSVVIPPDDLSHMKEHIRSLTPENPIGFVEHQIVMASGEVRWQRWSDRAIFDKDGHVVEYQSVGKDITKRKWAEEEIWALNRDLEKRVEERTTQLNQSLSEKETLLKEIHHRVKNNLQIIASLLNLQSQYIKDERTLAVIRESQNRIKAMALIHEKIYQSKSLDRIDYGDYLEKITRSLFESYGVSPKKITMKIHAKNVVLHIDKAIPCSLIINELVSNSFKHAFPNDRTGVVQIDVKLDGDTIRLLYSDNGIGLPESVTLDRTESLGMRLISGLTQQLKGTVEIKRGEGTTFVIAFKV